MLQFFLIADSSVNKFESYLLNQCYFFNTLLFHELTSSISKQIGHNRPIVLCGNILYSNSFLPGRSQGFANLRTSYRSRDHADFSLRYLCRKTYNATQLHMKYIPIPHFPKCILQFKDNQKMLLQRPLVPSRRSLPAESSSNCHIRLYEPFRRLQNPLDDRWHDEKVSQSGV